MLRKLLILVCLSILAFQSADAANLPGTLKQRYGIFKPYGIPTIDWSNPLTQYLAGIWVLNGSQVTNLVTGEPAIPHGTVSPKPYAQGLSSYFQGQFNVATANNYYITRNARTLGGSASWTVMAATLLASGHDCNGSANSNGEDIYNERGTSGNDIIKLQLCAGNTAFENIGITYRNDAGTLIQIGYSPVVAADNKVHVYAATKNGSGGSGNVLVYRDAVALTGGCLTSCTGNWTSNDNFTDATVKTYIGTDPTTTAEQYPDGVLLVLVWKTALSKAAVVSLSQNPYQFLIFPQDLVASALKTFAGGGGGTGAPVFFNGFP